MIRPALPFLRIALAAAAGEPLTPPAALRQAGRASLPAEAARLDLPGDLAGPPELPWDEAGPAPSSERSLP